MPANILVVDDEQGPRESLRMILKNEHTVRLAGSGPEALKLIQQDKPDLVFLDIRMPGMEGTEVLRQIKQRAPEVEVAMITAYAGVPSAQRAMRLGAMDYLTKPFGVAEVEAVVDRALARKREQNEEEIMLRQLSETITQLSQALAQARGPDAAANEGALVQGLASAHSSIENQLTELVRLSSIGEVAAEVAHDLRNLLSTILFRIELMPLNRDQSGNVDLGTLQDGLEQIALAARDGGEALKRISGNPYEPNEEVDVNAVLEDAVRLSEGRVRNPEQHRVVWELSEVPTIQGSAAGLRTVFTNAVINAHQAITGEGEIHVASFVQDGRVVAQISDSGAGMPEDVLARLADPFFTTKGDEGTGLGLTVAHKVIAQHHGEISFDSAPGEGTTVTIRLPLAQPPRSAETANRSILVVDDQQGMVKITTEVLQLHGFEVTSSASPREALALVRQAANDGKPAPAVLVTDLRMPDMLGTELAAEIRQLSPQTRVVLLSAYLEECNPDEDPNIDLAVSKPFDLVELATLIDDLLERPVAGTDSTGYA